MSPIEPKPGITDHLMFGYALHVSRLAPEDLDLFSDIELGDSELKNCVAVEGEDLGTCIAAVVDITKPCTLWSDTDGRGTPLPGSELEPFAMAVTLILRWTFPHLRGSRREELPAADSRAVVLDQAHRIDPFFLDDAATSGAEPGPYEGIKDKELAVAIDTITNHGFADEEVGSVDRGLFGARVDRFILWTDDRGFKSLMACDSVREASLHMEREDKLQNSGEIL